MLYVVATPIGNLGDLSPRAVEVLRRVALILAEDTRVSAKLLLHFGIDTPTRPYFDHNERAVYPGLLTQLERGDDIALISDAGTPLLSDPGFYLVRAAQRAGLPVVAVPGASAITAALSIAGLPADRFVFEGFLPNRSSARRKRLAELASEPRTLVCFEAPHRIAACLADACEVLGAERDAFVGRELTKLFEEGHAGDLAALRVWIEANPTRRRGEFVLAIAGSPVQPLEDLEARRVLGVLLRRLPVSQAVAAAGEILHAPANRLYRIALQLAEKAAAEQGE